MRPLPLASGCPTPLCKARNERDTQPKKTVDITPTWGEWGRVYQRLIRSSQHRDLAIKELTPDFARTMAAAEALKTIHAGLTDEQKATVKRVIAAELEKQGF